MHMKKVVQKKIGMMSHSWEIAQSQAEEAGMSVSEWFDWVTLCQQYSAADANKLFGLRASRGRLKQHATPEG
jgi:hypothetical protein